MPQSPAAVVFDLDDTLAVTARPRQTLLDDATTQVSSHRIDRADYLTAHGEVDAPETRAPIFERLLDADASVTPAELATAYRQAIENALEPLPGAAGLVDGLRDEYRVGLLTDGPVVAQQGKLAVLDWEELFDAVVITGSLATSKPDRRAFEAICDALGVEPGETVYVGDRPEVDIAGAADAGFRTIQVLTPDEPEPHPAATATVDRADLVERLPEIIPTV